ncbi:hypothetical protein F5Y05DRAFT_419088 [Hypoxylon sp. FL0543]|nr:hypothetical protein F5Y05DRAFT_419088 [Hypoxylon sp. FL0543]
MESFKGNGPWHISLILDLPNIQDVIAVLGNDAIQMAFEEYARIRPSLEPVDAKKYTAYIYDMIGAYPSTMWVANIARCYLTDEPWAEALFVHRVISYLESVHCTAVTWSHTDYYPLLPINGPSVEEQQSINHATAMERYWVILEILERLQLDRYLRCRTRDLEENLEAMDLDATN